MIKIISLLFFLTNGMFGDSIIKYKNTKDSPTDKIIFVTTLADELNYNEFCSFREAIEEINSEATIGRCKIWKPKNFISKGYTIILRNGLY